MPPEKRESNKNAVRQIVYPFSARNRRGEEKSCKSLEELQRHLFDGFEMAPWRLAILSGIHPEALIGDDIHLVLQVYAEIERWGLQAVFPEGKGEIASPLWFALNMIKAQIDLAESRAYSDNKD